MMNLFDKTPVIKESAFAAPSVSIISNVQIGEKSSIWNGCIL